MDEKSKRKLINDELIPCLVKAKKDGQCQQTLSKECQELLISDYHLIGGYYLFDKTLFRYDLDKIDGGSFAMLSTVAWVLTDYTSRKQDILDMISSKITEYKQAYDKLKGTPVSLAIELFTNLFKVKQNIQRLVLTNDTTSHEGEQNDIILNIFPKELYDDDLMGEKVEEIANILDKTFGYVNVIHTNDERWMEKQTPECQIVLDLKR